jgi:hypothetical protein
MLDHFYVRPKTADRIRALWLGPAIDQYAAGRLRVALPRPP